MVRYLKHGQEADTAAATDARTRATVEAILGDVEARGDQAVRELSERFDTWSPTHFRLSDAEIEAALSAVSASDLEDIRFAQAQVRNFAWAQRAAIQDVEVETLPGVVLGHKNIPIERGRLLRAGRQVSRCSLPPTCRVSHREGGGRGPRRSRARRRSRGGPAPRHRHRACTSAGADEIYCLGGIQAVGAMAIGTQSIAPVDMLVGPRQCVRRRGQAPALWPGGHRPLRRADRDTGDRRRYASTARSAQRTCSVRPSTASNSPPQCCSRRPRSWRARRWPRSNDS